MKKIAIAVLLFAVLCAALGAMGRREPDGTRPRKVEVSGTVRRVGNEPFSYIVITGEEHEWIINENEQDKLNHLQHGTVTVRGKETYADRVTSKGVFIRREYFLRNITIISPQGGGQYGTGLRNVRVSGTVGRVGNEPFSRLVIIGKDREWYIDAKENSKLIHLENGTVIVRAKEYNDRGSYYLKDITVISSRGGELVGPEARDVEVSGTVRRVGNEPFSYMVISADEREWIIEPDEKDKLMHLQQETVIVRAKEYYQYQINMNMGMVSFRYYLKDITVISPRR